MAGIAYSVRRWRWVSLPLWTTASVALGYGILIPAVWLRPQPSPLDLRLFEGVRYERLVSAHPVAKVVHVVTIDLRQPGLSVFVTPPVSQTGTSTQPAERKVLARTTSGFAREFKQQLAVNANFFTEQFSFTALYYYPKVGEPVDAVGHAVSDFQVYGIKDRSMRVLAFRKDGASIAPAVTSSMSQAVSGYPLVVRGAMPKAVARSTQRMPRVAAGVDASGGTLILVVADGRQPYYSDGANLRELAELVLERGAVDAVLLDGGGSSTLVRMDEDGRVVVMNTPVHGRTPPGFERPVGNHLGFAGLIPVN